MTPVILVTGPARSGKSEWAEYLAHQSRRSVVYVATAEADPQDQEWQERLIAHQQRRLPTWTTLEVPQALAATLQQAQSHQCYLVDSLGTWVANLLSQPDHEWQLTVEILVQTLVNVQALVIVVAEEAGWGVVPAYPLGRSFRDRMGTLVRQIGAIAESVYLVTGGHALNLSQLATPLTEINFSPESDCNLPPDLPGF